MAETKTKTRLTKTSKRETEASSSDFANALSPIARTWFAEAFDAPTPAQSAAIPAISRGESVLLLAPTGSGKTLSAFLAALDRILFPPAGEEPFPENKIDVLYVSPLKALASDIEQNLRAPITGLARVAEREGNKAMIPEVGVRTGDTPPALRAKWIKKPPRILVTTPESLFLMLTSRAAESLTHVRTLIVDEIHALAPTKRGTHMMTSVERLEVQRTTKTPLQRIGLSATQTPASEVATFLGGFAVENDGTSHPREVTILDVTAPRKLSLSIEMPAMEMSSSQAQEAAVAHDPSIFDETNVDFFSFQETEEPRQNGIWTKIHPQILALIRSHRTTLVFANSRRLTERLSLALNELAGEEIALAHHGALAKSQRQLLEERLKVGELRCIVATSSLELGIDVGSVNLVIQVESPPSVAAGMQRIGRANHHVGGTPAGVFFPKHRADLLAATALTKRMNEGRVEATAYIRNPLDVLAQQIVAHVVALGSVSVQDVFKLFRSTASYSSLPREELDNVLDMLSGKYPSDDFADLKPRLIWDRAKDMLQARSSAKSLVIANAGVIPDRGLYGVFLDTGDGEKKKRVGELDEEMVFEAREGEVFLLGATAWKITDISRDRVMVVPAPGEPGKMPFWKGEKLGRTYELGLDVGKLSHELDSLDSQQGIEKLENEYGLSRDAAETLTDFIHEQKKHGSIVPTHDSFLLETNEDEFGDLRLCFLSPLGEKVHAPLALAWRERIRDEYGVELETLFFDDGIVFRVPREHKKLDLFAVLPDSQTIAEQVAHALSGSAVFAARFRECAGRALLLPKRRIGERTPLWSLRKRAHDLLRAATEHQNFPIVLEAMRECLQESFDLKGLHQVLQKIERTEIRITRMESKDPSPFAASLLFNYIGNFIYEGDMPVVDSQRRGLAVDSARLMQLLGQDLQSELDPQAVDDAIGEVEGRRFPRKSEDLDAIHDHLRKWGEQSREELARFFQGDALETSLTDLEHQRRIYRGRIQKETRYIAMEDAGLYRDALGVPPPAWAPVAFLDAQPNALEVLAMRHARTHGPFSATDLFDRFHAPLSLISLALEHLHHQGKLVQGAFRGNAPGVETHLYCETEILRRIKRKTLARLRNEVEAVDESAVARFAIEWHGLAKDVPMPSRSSSDLELALSRLQAWPVHLSVLEDSILPIRVQNFRSADLDAWFSSGYLLWQGVEGKKPGQGKIALYFRDSFARLAPVPSPTPGELEARIRDLLQQKHALFFTELVQMLNADADEVFEAMWRMVWNGEVSNDSLLPLRSAMALGASLVPMRGTSPMSSFVRGNLSRTTRMIQGSEGRWSLLPSNREDSTSQAIGWIEQLLTRHGLVARETVASEWLPGGFSSIYRLLSALEEQGRIRRGYFASGFDGMQFALRGVDQQLRNAANRAANKEAELLRLASTDPANLYGSTLKWPKFPGESRAQRSQHTEVLLQDGALVAWVSRGGASLLFPETDSSQQEEAWGKLVAALLKRSVERGQSKAMLIEQINGGPAGASSYARIFAKEGFSRSSSGLLFTIKHARFRATSAVFAPPTMPFAITEATTTTEPDEISWEETD